MSERFYVSTDLHMSRAVCIVYVVSLYSYEVAHINYFSVIHFYMLTVTYIEIQNECSSIEDFARSEE
jgi:hypothetical protein